LVFGFIKIGLSLKNLLNSKKKHKSTIWFSTIRILLLVVSIDLLLQDYIYFALIAVIAAELLDRFLFYTEIQILTPKNHLSNQFELDLNNKLVF